MINLANTPHFGVVMITDDNGVKIVEVVPDSEADDAGIQIDDIITLLDDKPVDHPGYFALLVSEKRIGETVTLTIIRNDQILELFATLGERP
jgi:serine protease Do